MRATNSTILAIYNHFEYYLFVEMAKKNLDRCWFYNYIEEFSDLSIFYFKAVDKFDPSISCKVRIAIDKYMYKYHDDLVGIFQSHEGWVFDMSNYDYDRHCFDIIFENRTRFGIRKEVFSVSGEGVKVKYIPLSRNHPILSMDEINYVDTDIKCIYETFYRDIYKDIAADRALKNKEARAQMDNVSHYILASTESYIGGFNPLRDITANEIREQLRLPGCKELPTFKFNNSGGHVPELSKPPIFNPPATICYWNDGTKTVVKCQKGDKYSPEAGLALCYMKKILGNTSKDLNKELHKYIPEEKHADKKKNIKTKKVKKDKTKKMEEK